MRYLSYPRYSAAIGRLPHALTSRHCRDVRSRRNEACTRPRFTRPRRGSYVIGNPVRCLSYPRYSAAIGRLRRRIPCRRGRRRPARRRRRWAVVWWPKSGRPPPPTRRAHHAEQGRRRTNLPTVVPNRKLPKHRRQNRRNEQHRPSSSCLPPVGPAARRDGSGGHRARELHASNCPEIERRRLHSRPVASLFMDKPGVSRRGIEPRTCFTLRKLNQMFETPRRGR